jgi:oxygen-dependent protoporphyrinogen oxidase
MHDIVDLVLERLGEVTIETGCAAVRIERLRTSWCITTTQGTVDAGALVSAVPGTVAASLFGSIAPGVSEVASCARYTPMTTVSIAWNAADVNHSLVGTGYITESPRPGEMSACTWTSSKIPSRARSGVVLLRGYVRTADKEVAMHAAVEEIRSVTGATAPALWTRTFGWTDAIPQYSVGHDRAVRAMRDAVTELGTLAFAGAMWDGVGLGSCIASGERAAGRVAAHLAQQPA